MNTGTNVHKKTALWRCLLWLEQRGYDLPRPQHADESEGDYAHRVRAYVDDLVELRAAEKCL